MSELADLSTWADHDSASIQKGKGFRIIHRHDSTIRQLQLETSKRLPADESSDGIGKPIEFHHMLQSPTT